MLTLINVSNDVIFIFASDKFSNLDKDNNGFLSRSEVEAAGVKWSDVAIYDLNSTYTFKPRVRIRKIGIILK